MSRNVIVIAVEGSAAALDWLEQRIDALIEDATTRGGITALTSERLDGPAAARAAHALQDAAADRTERRP